MRIHWWRATTDDRLIVPNVLTPFCIICSLVIVYAAILAGVEFFRGDLIASTVCAFFAAATSGLLLAGVHAAEQQARWRRAIERDVVRAAAEWRRPRPFPSVHQ